MLRLLSLLFGFVFAFIHATGSSPFNFLSLFGRNEGAAAAGSTENAISGLMTSIRDSAFLTELTKPDGFLGTLITEAISRSAKPIKPSNVKPGTKKLVKDLISAATDNGEPVPISAISSEASAHVENTLAKKFLGSLDKLTAFAQLDGGKKFIEMLNDPDVRNEIFAHIFNNGSQPSAFQNRDDQNPNSSCVCTC